MKPTTLGFVKSVLVVGGKGVNSLLEMPCTMSSGLMEWLPKDKEDVQIYCTGLIYIIYRYIYIYIDCIHLYQTWSRCKLWFVSMEFNFTRKGSLGWQTFTIVFAYHVQAMPQSPQRSELCQQTLSGESDMFKVFGSGLEVCKIPKMFKPF